MKIFLRVIIISLLISLFSILGYTIYSQNQELAKRQQNLELLKTNFFSLQKNFNTYQEKTKNMRQMVVLANSDNSKSNKISEILNKYLKNIDGDLSIYYKNLTTDESIIVDGDRKYYMASLYKVILTLYISDMVKEGEISFSDKIGSSSATLEQALDKIITESNNEYAQMLGNEYGWKEIEKSMKQRLGIDFSFDEKFETNVKNMGMLFEDIALSLKMEDSQSSYLLKLLNNQKRTSKLPKYLPDNIYSHNKTGEYEEYSHDAAIFYTAKANYILVFMSKTKLPGETNEQMALMSKEIYETLNNVNNNDLDETGEVSSLSAN